MDVVKILEQHGVPDKVYRHCLAVGSLSLAMARALNAVGLALDEELCFRGGILHDICRTEAEHAEKGRELLLTMGCTAEAEVVGAHMGKGIAVDSVGEKEVVFLADKLLQCDRRVTIDERYAGAAAKFAGDPEAIAAAGRRRDQALALKETVERLLGKSIYCI